MKIIEVNNLSFQGEIIGKQFLFEDDTSIDISLDDYSISDMEGMMVATESKIRAIEVKMNVNIIR